MKKYFLLVFFAALLLSLSNCTKSSVDYVPVPLSEYYPLNVGKYITYKLDSLIYINFGASSVTKNYEVKYYTDAEITDNLGRPAYRIIRYIRKLPTDPWVPDATFMAVNTTSTIEFVENNLRYISLTFPVKEGNTWKGNSYIDTYSLNSEVKYLFDWNYTYANINIPETINGMALDSVITVNQRDEVLGDTSDLNFYNEVNFGQEKYAKNIGLVYKKFFHSEYQPPVSGRNGYYQGYGITLSMIDHN